MVFSDKMPLTRDEIVELIEAIVRDISEENWAAGWMQNVEYNVWSTLCNGPYPAHMIEAKRKMLYLFAQECGGWVIWKDDPGQVVWISINEWLPKYAAWSTRMEEVIRKRNEQG